MRKSSIWIFLLSIVLFIRPVFDPDLWWHLAVGRYIAQTGIIPQTDIFTFSAPDYPYIYHSWLTELILYLIHNLFGLWGITWFYALIGALSLLLLYNTYRLTRNMKSNGLLDNWLMPISYLVMVPIIISYTNLRVQLITFLNLALVYYLYQKFLVQKSRLLYLLPVLFLIWANFHAGFILGLILFFTIVTIELIPNLQPNLFTRVFSQTKHRNLTFRRWTKLFYTFIVSTLTPLVNPFSIRIYQQAISMGSNQFAAKSNTDWFPLSQLSHTDLPSTVIYGFLLISAFLLILIKNPVTLKNKLLLIIFTLLSFLYSRRFSTAAIVILLPALFTILSRPYSIFISLKKFPILSFSLAILPFSCLLLLSGYWLHQTTLAYRDDQSYAQIINSQNQILRYPYLAFQYINSHSLPQPILNDFNWGGYLVWRLPKQKIFIDGRMDNFIINGQPFAQQYLDIIKLSPNWQLLLEQYQIQTIIISKQYPLIQALDLSPNWQLEYNDDTTVIYTRKTPP
jgi:hypothetical protein